MSHEVRRRTVRRRLGQLTPVLVALVTITLFAPWTAIHNSSDAGVAQRRAYLSPTLDVTTNTPSGAEYVALGDSYAASASYSEVAVFDVCTRTPRNMPRQIANTLQPRTFTDATCAGASLRDITVPRPNDYNSFADMSPQSDAVGTSTKLITVLAGFNSFGFGDILEDCLKTYHPDSCGVASTRLEMPDARDNAVDEATRTFKELARRAPSARVVVLGYIDMFDGYTSGCASPVTDDGVRAWRRWFPQVNPILEKAAVRSAVEYVAPPTGGGSCGSRPFVSVSGRDRGDRDDWFAFHPNQLAQTTYAAKIVDRLGTAR